MPKPQGYCIYCSGAGLTKEHIWADWLKAYIPRDMERHRVEEILEFPDRTKSVRIETRRQGDPHVRQLRVVCKSCNEGWMSNLQQSTKPFLVPMLKGEPVPMLKNGQRIVAAWVTMFVMTSDFLSPDKVSISANERAWFRKHRRPPSHWRIWLGRREPTNLRLRWLHRVMTFVKDEIKAPPPGTIPVANTQTTTILLGNHLVIHVMSSPIARRIVKRWQHLPIIASKLQQIWPIVSTRVIWPPTGPLLSPSEIGLLADYFWNRVDAVARMRDG